MLVRTVLTGSGAVCFPSALGVRKLCSSRTVPGQFAESHLVTNSVTLLVTVRLVPPVLEATGRSHHLTVLLPCSSCREKGLPKSRPTGPGPARRDAHHFGSTRFSVSVFDVSLEQG